MVGTVSKERLLFLTTQHDECRYYAGVWTDNHVTFHLKSNENVTEEFAHEYEAELGTK